MIRPPLTAGSKPQYLGRRHNSLPLSPITAVLGIAAFKNKKVFLITRTTMQNGHMTATLTTLEHLCKMEEMNLIAKRARRLLDGPFGICTAGNFQRKLRTNQIVSIRPDQSPNIIRNAEYVNTRASSHISH